MASWSADADTIETLAEGLWHDAPVPRTSILAESLRFDIGRLTLVGPLRAALVAGGVTAVALALGDARTVVPLVIGALFVGITDPQDSLPQRLVTMSAAALSCGVATLAGGLVSHSSVGHILAGAVVAAICAYVGILGPRAAMTGVLSLVLFLIASGTPTSPVNSVRDGLLVVAGGVLQLIVVSGGALVGGRDSGPRSAVATAYRQLAVSTLSDRVEDPSLDSSFSTAGTVATRTVAGADSAAWLGQLVEHGEYARLGLLALAHHAPPPGTATGQPSTATGQPSTATGQPGTATSKPAAEPRTLAAAAAVARQVARALVLPWRRRSLPTTLAALDAAHRDDLETGWDPDVLALAAEPLRQAGEAVAGTWPTPRHLWRHVGTAFRRSGTSMPSLSQRLAPQPAFVNHAIRLAIAIGVGIVFSELIDLPHTYWLPLTVAWVARPDLGSTITRVALRVIGTLAGASAMAAVFVLFDPGWLGLALLVAVGTLLANAFFTVNYATAVVGITTIMLTLFASLGESVEKDLLLRAAATLAGGALVAAIALVRPLRTTTTTTSVLIDAVDRLRDYATAVLIDGRTELHNERAATQAASARAHVLLTSTEHEPGAHTFAPGTGRTVLVGVMVTTAQLFVAEQAATRSTPHLTDDAQLSHATATVSPDVGPGVATGRQPDQRSVAAIEALAERLRAVESGVPPSPWTAVGTDDTSTATEARAREAIGHLGVGLD